VRADALDKVAALAAAGCPAVLLRPGAMAGRRFFELARAALPLCRDAGTELWIGDRADVALAVGADAVQLPARGLSIAGARRVVGEAMRVGRSVHGAAEAARAASEGADHLILGTVFATASHPGARPGGTALVAAARDAVREAGSSAPILAVGGMTPDTASAAVLAGAWGAAALSALWDAPDPRAAVETFLRAMEAARP